MKNKPCPFCGSEPVVMYLKNYIAPGKFDGFVTDNIGNPVLKGVGCNNHNCEVEPVVRDRDEQRAWDSWNKRLEATQ